MDDLLQITSNNYSWIQAQELVAKGHALVIQNVDKFVLPAATDCCRFLVCIWPILIQSRALGKVVFELCFSLPFSS